MNFDMTAFPSGRSREGLERHERGDVHQTASELRDATGCPLLASAD